MNIPPILEKLLLSNEAEFKNASLGMNALNMMIVPEGKTAVILSYEINAFCNAYVNSDVWVSGVDSNTAYGSFFSVIIQHILFQMQIVNDKYFTAFTHYPDFTISPYVKNTDTHPTISLNFKSKSQDLFIYVDRSTYFQLVFQDFEFFIPYYGTYQATFENNLQNIPGQPITFKGSPSNTNYYSYSVTPGISGISENYNPTRKEQIEAVTYNSYLLPNGQQEYLRFGTNTGSNNSSLLNPFNAMPVPPGTPDPVVAANMFLMPTINVQYALINKRPTDYGITTGYK